MDGNQNAIDARLHLRADDSQLEELTRVHYKRQDYGKGPQCRICGRSYRAASTRGRVTFYSPRCECAPPGCIKVSRRPK